MKTVLRGEKARKRRLCMIKFKEGNREDKSGNTSGEGRRNETSKNERSKRKGKGKADIDTGRKQKEKDVKGDEDMDG